MKKTLALLVVAFLAVGNVALAQNAPDISYVGGNNGAVSYSYQGAFYESAPMATLRRT